MREWVGRLARTAIWVVIVLLASRAAAPLVSFAARAGVLSEDEAPVATVVGVHGSVSVIRDHGTAQERIMSPVKTGLWLYRGDQVWTGENSWIEVQFEESARVRVDASSRVVVVAGLLREVDQATGAERPTLRLLVGRLWVHVAEALSRLRNFSVETPSAIAGVRGTIFMIEVGVTGRSVVSVHQGVVAVASPQSPRNEHLVGVNEVAEVLPGQLPAPPKESVTDASARWLEMREWLDDQIRWKTELSRQLAAEGGAEGPSGVQSGGAGPGSGAEPGGDAVPGTQVPDDGDRKGLVGGFLDFFTRLFGSSGSRGGSLPDDGDGGEGDAKDDGDAMLEPGGGITLPNPGPIGVPMLPRVFSLTEGESESQPSTSAGTANGESITSLDDEPAEDAGAGDTTRTPEASGPTPGSADSEVNESPDEDDRAGSQGGGLGGPPADRGRESAPGQIKRQGDDAHDDSGGGLGGPPAGRGRESAPGQIKRQGEDVHDGSDGEEASSGSG